MNRTFSHLAPALLVAAGILFASALAVLARQAAWTAVVCPLVLVMALLGADLIHRRRSGGEAPPSPSVLLLAVAILVACGIVGFRDPRSVAEMLPLLGSCAALPVILRRTRAAQAQACRQA
jgi:hypothetical protein